MKKYKFLILIIFMFISCSNEVEQVRISNLTDTPTPMPTNTPTPMPTNTPTPMPTNTPIPMPTNTPIPMPTNTPIPKKVDEINKKSINISGFQFLDKEISINVGTTVTWTNKDNSIHTASSIDYKFDSGYLNQNQSYEFKFISAGIYTYRCNLHSGMTGKISVFTENGLLIDPTPTPSPTSTPTPNNSNQRDQISPSQPQSSYY